MALPNALKNFNVFRDGLSYMGVVEEIKLPTLTRKMEEFRGGGMDGPVAMDVGQEKIEVETTCGGFEAEIYKQYGLTKVAGTMLRYAGAYQKDDTAAVQAVEIVTRGRLSEVSAGDAKAGDKGKTVFKMACTYFKLTVDGKDVIEIDLLSFLFKVDGKDMLEDQRKAIGLA